MVQNSAFVFIKPHANTPKAREVVKAHLESNKIKCTKEGTITAKEIDEKQLIDNHYYAIASKATILKPSELNVPKPKFTEKFGKDWDTELSAGNIVNAKQACEKWGMNAEELNTVWAKAKKADRLVKFGGGFYCGLVQPEKEGCSDLYVMNGFFMSMRSNFVAEGASIYYFVVEWESKDLSWEDFRGKVLGPTDPVTAPEDSARGLFYKNWESYGLTSVPNVGDNAVHASASPFEALSEKTNWLSLDPTQDTTFGIPLLKLMDRKTFDSWSKDPSVSYGPNKDMTVKKSVFDSVEDLDSDECLFKLTGMYLQQSGGERVLEDMCVKIGEMGIGA